MRCSLTLRLTVATAFALGATASARVVPMLPQIKPAPSPEVRERFQEAVTRGLGNDAISAVEVRMRLAGSHDLVECSGGACAARVSSLLRADKIVVTEIDQVGKNYGIKIRVLETDGSDAGKAIEERCDICSAREADAAVQKAASRALPLLVARSAPRPAPSPGDSDGPEAPRLAPTPREEASRTPPATSPPRSIEDERPPARAPESAATATPPTVTPRTVEDTDRSGFPYRPVAYGSFAVAGAALVTTIVFASFAAKENDPSCDKPNGRTSCPDIYKGNVAPTVVFGVLTAVAAGTGALLLYLDHRHKRGATVGVGPMQGGVAASASFEF